MPGPTINRPDTLVQGTVEGFTGDDIGVTVNGVVANVYGNQFAANHVPLSEGDNNIITVFAVNDAADSATASVTVSAHTTGDYITLTSNPASGIPPLDFTLNLTKTYTSNGYSFSYIGPGTVANMGDDTSLMQFKRRITTEPGLYYITADDTQTLDSGATITYSDTIAVMADDRTHLDTKLKAKWDGMKAGFASSNITQALKYYSSFSNEKYNTIFSAISDQLPAIAADMQNIQMINVDDIIAKYRIVRMDMFNGQTLPITYYVYFIKDINGLWKIDKW